MHRPKYCNRDGISDCRKSLLAYEQRINGLLAAVMSLDGFDTFSDSLREP